MIFKSEMLQKSSGSDMEFKLRNLFYYMLTNIIIVLFVLYLYDFRPNTVTLTFCILIPVILTPLFMSDDLMNPLNIFLMSHFFLSLINLLDVNINQTSLRYASIDYNTYDLFFVYSILVILTWIFFVLIGFELSKLTKKSLIISKFSYTMNRPILIASFCFLLAVIGFVLTLNLMGGINGMIEASHNRTAAYAGNNYLGKIVLLGAFGPLILLLHGYKKSSLLTMCLIFTMVSMFGGRTVAFFGVIFPYLICYHYTVRKIKFKDLIAIGILALLFVIYFGQYRVHKNFNVDLNNLSDVITSAAGYTEMGNILPSLIVSLKENRIPYSLGRTLISIFYAPIPRSLWSNKPVIDESSIIGNLLIGENSWGLPPGPYGIAYYNFGIIGVIFLGLVAGFVVGFLYKNLINREATTKKNMSIIYYAIVIKYIFEMFSTSAQINILWYTAFFMIIKYLDLMFKK